MKKVKNILRVVGIIGALASIALLIGAGTLLFADKTKDSGDYFNTWAFEIEKESRAVVIGPASFNKGFLKGDMSIYKAEVSNHPPSQPIFLGIAEKRDLDAYLNGVSYDDIARIRIWPATESYQNHPGGSVPGDPGSQDVWHHSTQGDETQVITWRLEAGGRWLVLMNEDGSAGINMTVNIKTKSSLVFMTGMTNFGIGVVTLLLSILLFTSSSKNRNPMYPRPLQTRPPEENEPEK